MSDSDLYTLKYELKRALAEPDQSQQGQPGQSKPGMSLSRQDRERLRQVQKEVSLVGRAYWVYGAVDLSYSMFNLLRQYRSNSFLLAKMAQKTVLFCTIRLFLLYEAQGYLCSQHMLKNAKPILQRKVGDQRKEDLLSKMNQF